MERLAPTPPCLALRHLGSYDEANGVARHVLETWGHRDGSAAAN